MCWIFHASSVLLVYNLHNICYCFQCNSDKNLEIGHALGGGPLRFNAGSSSPFRMAWIRFRNVRSLGSVLEIEVYKSGSQPESPLAIGLFPSSHSFLGRSRGEAAVYDDESC